MLGQMTQKESREISAEFIGEMIYYTSRHGLRKYGANEEYIKTHPEYNHINCLIARLGKYLSTGNKKYLVDVADFAMLEFKHPLAQIQK